MIEGGMKCVKYLLFAFNLIFLVSSFSHLLILKAAPANCSCLYISFCCLMSHVCSKSLIEGGIQCVKYLLFAFNLIFLVSPFPHTYFPLFCSFSLSESFNFACSSLNIQFHFDIIVHTVCHLGPIFLCHLKKIRVKVMYQGIKSRGFYFRKLQFCLFLIEYSISFSHHCKHSSVSLGPHFFCVIL